MVGQSRAPKSGVKQLCVWCREGKQTLKYVLPTQNGKKEFCSEICLAEFRRAYNKGACTTCDNVIRTVPIRWEEKSVTKEFCSTECLSKYQSEKNFESSSSSSSSSPLPRKNAGKFPPGIETKPHNPASSGPLGGTEFNWEDYLKETNSQPAPPDCFKQHLTPPGNEFKPGMKLEAIDPRNETSTCVATVIGSIGPRLRLRLDGSDNSNDFWRLVDSSEINPVGTCEKQGGMLQPPLGYRNNASNWRNFLQRNLSGAEMASPKCFKKEPKSPPSNLFEVGMKLEAVDRKNPHLICVATVGDVKEDFRIHVQFDGWRGAFDYWTCYDSRDIFPVGWCRLSGHPLQPPGQKGKTGAGNVVTAPKSKSIAQNPGIVGTTGNSYSHARGAKAEVPEPETTLYINSACDTGSLDPLKIKQYLPTINGTLEELYNRLIMTFNECMSTPSPKIKSSKKKFADLQEFETEVRSLVRLTGSCENLISFHQGPCLSCSKKKDGRHKESTETATRKRAQPLPSDSTVQKAAKVEPKPEIPAPKEEKTVSSTSSLNNVNHVHLNVTTPPASTTHQVPQAQVAPSSHLLTTTPTKPILNTEGVASSPSPAITTPTTASTTPAATIRPRLASTSSDPSEWTVEDVIRHIETVDSNLAIHADIFRKHEIDGKAMLLLNSDMMMKYMGLKLGPALKICNIIGKFRGSKYGGGYHHRTSSNGL